MQEKFTVDIMTVVGLLLDPLSKNMVLNLLSDPNAKEGQAIHSGEFVEESYIFIETKVLGFPYEAATTVVAEGEGTARHARKEGGSQKRKRQSHYEMFQEDQSLVNREHGCFEKSPSEKYQEEVASELAAYRNYKCSSEEIQNIVSARAKQLGKLSDDVDFCALTWWK
eukprot:Sdes_comp20994_c0_seq4m19707